MLSTINSVVSYLMKFCNLTFFDNPFVVLYSYRCRGRGYSKPIYEGYYSDMPRDLYRKFHDCSVYSVSSVFFSPTCVYITLKHNRQS